MSTAYRSPESDLINESDISPRPVKAIVMGLLINVFLAGIVTLVLVISLLGVVGIEETMTEAEIISAITGNVVFLLADMCLSLALCVWGGYVAAKYVPGQEIKFGVILGVVTLVILGGMFIIGEDPSATYPLWYTAGTLLAVIPVSILGAKLRK